MGRTILIIIVIALIIGAAWYFLIKKDKPSENVGNGDGYQPPPRPGAHPIGDAVPVPMNISVKVNPSEVVSAIDPANYFSNLTVDNANSHNVHKTADKTLPLIHYITGFNSGCYQFIWYKYGLYTNIGMTTDADGNKTCSYKFDRNVLPKQIKVQLMSYNADCNVFKYYISGVEYRYRETKTEGMGLTHGLPRRYCIYDKV